VTGIAEKVKKYIDDNWKIRIRKLRGRTYVSARKTINGKLVEKGLGYVTDEELNEIKKLAKTVRMKKHVRKKEHKETSITTTRQQLHPPAKQPSQGRYGGQECVGVVGRVCRFGVHRLGLRFLKPWVSPLFLQQFGRVKFVERSKQYVLRLEVGVKRWFTVQVNRDGTAQVFLECSDNPLGIEEFIGFCKFYLIEVFRRITGRQVSLSDFEVMVAPEVNCDMEGVKLLEGVKSITLEEYYDEVVRIYYSEPGVKESMPEGGTRVEVRAGCLRGMGLGEVVEGVVSVARLPAVLSEIKKDLEVIKGSLPAQRLDVGQLSEVVAAKLANLIYLTFEKWGSRFELALRMLGTRLQETLNPVFERLERLERENAELRRRLGELTQQDSAVRFTDLPQDLRGFLRVLERDGYVRLTETRVSYGDRVWAAIFRRRGNIDGWIREESVNYPSRRELFEAVIKAIRYHDNRYGGRPGVPYDRFLDALSIMLGRGDEEKK